MSTEMIAVGRELRAWAKRQSHAVRDLAERLAENLKEQADEPVTWTLVEMFEKMIAALEQTIRASKEPATISIGIDDAVALASEIAFSPA